MRKIEFSGPFKRDYKRVMKRRVNVEKFDYTLSCLQNDISLPPHCHPHMLFGEWLGFWECHIESDWLLIYDISNPEFLVLHRTGTHADLFE